MAVHAALSLRTLREEQAYALANSLFHGGSKFALAVMVGHVDTPTMIEFRKQLRPLNASFVMHPLAVTRRVVTGTKFAPLLPLLGGRVRLLVSESPVATARIALDLASKYPNRFVPLGGCYEATPVNQAMLKAIAELPLDNDERVRLQFGQLVSFLRSPAYHLYRSLNSHSMNLVGSLVQLKHQLAEKEKSEKSAPAQADPASSEAAPSVPVPASS